MVWIRAEDSEGQEILDEVEVFNTLYVKVPDNKNNNQSEEEQDSIKNTERRELWPIHQN